MAAPFTEDINEIGTVAGRIWNYLNDQGSVTMTRLAKDLNVPRDTVMRGVGWLAREGKIAFSKNARSRQIGLSENGSS